MISKEIEEALNGQVAMECYASNAYLAMGSWFEREGLRGCAQFMFAQSDEERMHMLKIVQYINEVDGAVTIAEIKAPNNDFDSMQHVFETALAQEQGVTKSINSIVDLGYTQKDFATVNFLQWFVQEQVEEENLFNTVLDMIRLNDLDKRNMLILDREIAGLKANEPGGQA